MDDLTGHPSALSPNPKTLYSVATVTVEHAPLASCILSTTLLTIPSFQHLPLSLPLILVSSILYILPCIFNLV